MTVVVVEEKGREADPRHIYEYMRFRAKEEGVPHGFTLGSYEFLVNGGEIEEGKRYGGTLSVFGVQLAEDGTILRDEHQPEILARYRRRSSRGLLKALKAAIATWDAYNATSHRADEELLMSSLWKATSTVLDRLEPLYNNGKLSPMAVARAESIYLLVNVDDQPEAMRRDTLFALHESYNTAFKALLAELDAR